MGSSRGHCEIVEERNVPTTSSRMKDRDINQRPPIVNKGLNKSLEDDINKLFKAVNLRTSKGRDLSDPGRNPSKRPIRGNGSQSPGGIGFSAPVSLKQSLRGLCISQAAEAAVLKRLSMPSSPCISEFGKITNLYRSVGESGRTAPEVLPNVNKKESESLKHGEDANSSLLHNKDIEVDTRSVEITCLTKPECHSVSALPHENAFDNVSKSFKKASDFNKVAASEDSTTHSKKATPKMRKKSKQIVPSPIVVKRNKDTKIMSRTVKPVVRKKLIIIKKEKKVPLATGGNVKVSNSHIICQRCQCSPSDIVADMPSELVTISTVKTNNATKSSEKEDITQCSESSDFSSSNTSPSDGSNRISVSVFCNRPHMSKDMRWEAIEHVRKQYGFLGLNHFNLLKKLGSGDIGTVYLSELIGTNCVFAIKVMDNEFLARRKKMPRAKTEREILRMLDHPFLPTLYAQFTSDSLSCLVMEFCPGGDLHVLRQKQPYRYFAEAAARFYVAEVLLALEYLHMLGIVYRDLKPENIMVREDGHIMLTDFDLSLRCSVNPILLKLTSLKTEPPRVSGPCVGSNCVDPFCTGPSCKMSCFSPRLLHSTARARKLKAEAAPHARSLPQLVAEPTEARSNSFVGTHEYLAPEIIKGEGHGSAVDWWTLGVFLYELLYGKTPFKGANNDETLDNVVFQNLRFPDRPIVSFYARDLIKRLLVKEPEHRLGTETGAAEIKRHPFFNGMNWALIRCAAPPEVPELFDAGNLEMDFQENGSKFMECSVDGDHLEFELF